MSAAAGHEIDEVNGAHAEGVEPPCEIETVGGSLRNLTASWEDVQRTRLALDQRGIPSVALKREEDRLARQVRHTLETHPVWPWLSQYPGLGGVHTARIIALISDPHRFPGRQCTAGHHHSAVVGVDASENRSGCGIELADGTVCTAPIGPVRRGTGTRSLWHYLGLHVVDGHSPRKHKGQRADWNPVGKTAVLMPGGIAEQIVRHRPAVPTYNTIYVMAKERLSRERAEATGEVEPGAGPLPIHAAEAEKRPEGDMSNGLRPFQIDAIARKVAAKAFVADLLRAWKEVSDISG
jgi:hypothetical protein